MKKLRILSLNCQRGHQPGLEAFLKNTLKDEAYDALLLQEVNPKVLRFLEHPAYEIIRAFSEEAGQESELCIVYRKTYVLSGQGFRSFARMHKDPWHTFRHPTFGILWSDLEANGAKFRVGSIHLHSGINALARLRELRLAKKLLLAEPALPTFFAGDFNAGYPGEASFMAYNLSPQFGWTTKRSEPTLNSLYTEVGPHLFNKTANLLASVNIGFRFRTDHFFANASGTTLATLACSVLPDRVSDHSPVELEVHVIHVTHA